MDRNSLYILENGIATELGSNWRASFEKGASEIIFTGIAEDLARCVQTQLPSINVPLALQALRGHEMFERVGYRWNPLELNQKQPWDFISPFSVDLIEQFLGPKTGYHLLTYGHQTRIQAPGKPEIILGYSRELECPYVGLNCATTSVGSVLLPAKVSLDYINAWSPLIRRDKAWVENRGPDLHSRRTFQTTTLAAIQAALAG